jgi:AraC-like DNA-binding protein
MFVLDQNMPTLEPDATDRLQSAVQAMLVACLAPTTKRTSPAGDQIKLTLKERVRQAVRRNLRSPSLGPVQLCREAATSRSQLYRLLEDEGGVARYIQRLRLSEGFSMLCDATCNLTISKVAELLCFPDASGFSRAFRREFGMNPGEVRSSSLYGLPPVPPAKRSMRPAARTFSDCLRAY